MGGDEEKGPNRTCVATRKVLPVEDLIRFALDAEGRVTPDIRARLPGRGVWVEGTRAALTEAMRRKAFARSFKQAAAAAPDLPDQVENLLLTDARQSLSMANKAGLVVTGFAKVEGAIAGGRVVSVLSASDGSEDGRRKLAQAVRRHSVEADILTPFSGQEMDLALGRENAIHAALLAGPASDAFMKRRQRLDRYRHGTLDGTGPDAEANSASTGHLVLDDRQGQPALRDE